MINIKGITNKNYETKKEFFKEDLITLEQDMEKIMDQAAIDFRETLDSYESSFKKIENLDFLDILDKNFYHLDILTNTLTIEQIEKDIKEIYKDLEAYKHKLINSLKLEKYVIYIEKVKNNINKIEKYLEYKRLDNKYAVKNTTEKRNKI